MSGGGRDLYHHSDLFFDDDVCSFFSHKPTIDGCTPQDIHSLSPPPVTPIMNFYDYGSFEKAFDMSPSSLPHLDAFSSGELCMDGGKNLNISATGGAGVTGTPTTPNSSVTWSSTEAAGDEKDQPKPEEEVMQLPAERNEDGGDDGSKKQSKPRKKGEKRTREPRFAFVTKSDVDHLEDGYRWRKYGQKAVKNSPYPRSYYRCTTQKCPVKKRVERSFQDPDTVITTYEGQHTHHSPATIRGSSHMLAPQPSLQSNYLHFPMMNQLHPMNNNGQQRQMMNPSMYLQNRPTTQQQLQLSDYGLLQDIVPSYVNNSQP